MSTSLALRYAQLPDTDRDAFRAQAGVSEADLLDDWRFWARPEQLPPPGDWMIWFLQAGRRFGKTRAASEWIVEGLRELTPLVPGGQVQVGLVGTKLEAVRLIMVEGESGLSKTLPRSMWKDDSWERTWNRGPCELHLSTGAFLKGYSAERPRDLRGPSFHRIWVDEPATLKDAHLGLTEDTTFSNALLALSAPPDPRMIVTGTPKNNRLIHQLLDDPTIPVSRGSTFDNLAHLAPKYFSSTVARYRGTRLGQQELYGELLEDLGQVFQRGWFDIVPALPVSAWTRLRFWDLASTEPWEGNQDPDWTVGALVAVEHPEPVKLEDGTVFLRPRRIAIEHIARFRKRAGPRNEEILKISNADGIPRVGIEQEPGRGGPDTIRDLTAYLHGVARVIPWPQSVDKLTRSEILSGPAEQGRVLLVRSGWDIDAFLDEADEFPNGAHDDIVDAICSAIAVQTPTGSEIPPPAVSGKKFMDKGSVSLR